MGLLFTTEGTRRIVNTLNTAFDGPTPTGKPLIGLDVIRGLAGTPPNLTAFGTLVAGRNWAPGQVAGMLDLLPYDQGNESGGNSGPKGKLNPRDTRRWNYFLTSLSPAVFKLLQNALAGAILNQDDNGSPLNYKIIRAAFDHVHTDPNTNPNLVVFDAPLPGFAGAYVRHITLFTPEVPNGNLGNNFGPPIINGAPWHGPT